MESPEIHPPHRAHAGGVRWLEITASVAALVVSFASIFIAVQHGKTMEKLVTANSMPYIDAGLSNATLDGKPQLSLNLTNKGVGPAHQQSLKFKVGGRYMHNYQDVLAEVFGPRAAEARRTLIPYVNSQRTRFIPARDRQPVYFVDKTAANASDWEAFNHTAKPMSVEVCYCSVFDECWRRVDEEEPRPVKQCVRDEPNEFRP